MQYYIKWRNTIVGKGNLSSFFIEAPFIHAVHKLFPKDVRNLIDVIHGRVSYVIAPKDLEAFVLRRIPSKERKDIDRILEFMGLETYDWKAIMLETQLFHPSDSLWITKEKDERFEDALPYVLKSIFIDRTTDTVAYNHSPDGVNKKHYASSKGSYGIVKERLGRSKDDVECEVTAYYLAKLMGVPCCETWFVNKNGNEDPSVFSKFEYVVGSDLFVHFVTFWKDKPFTVLELLEDNPSLQEDICRMVYFDFITRQTDRHLKNFAVYYDGEGPPKFYPLYDNGRSLLYDDGDDIPFDLSSSVKKPWENCPKFGKDSLIEAVAVCNLYHSPSEVMNLNVDKEKIREIVKNTQRTKSRVDLIVEWVWNSIQHLKKIE